MNGLCVLFWFLPPVWWMRQRLYDEQDRASDECASVLVGSNIRFAEAIKEYAVNTLNHSTHHSTQHSTLQWGLSFSHSQPAIVTRIASILEKENTQLTRLPLVSKLALTVPFVLIVTVVSWASHFMLPLEILQYNVLYTRQQSTAAPPQLLLMNAETSQNNKLILRMEFSHPMQIPDSPDMAVYASMTGKINGTLHRGFNGILLFESNRTLHPGETIQTVFTENMQSVFGSALAQSVQWNHTIQTQSGTGKMSAVWDEFDPKLADTDSIVFGDLDLDGDLDMVVGNKWNYNAVCLNDGTGKYERFYISDEDFVTHEIVLADFDNDGDLDIAEGNGHNQPNYIYFNDGYGRFPHREIFGTGEDI